MQTNQVFLLDTYNIISEKDIINFTFPLNRGARIFLYGDLGSGKSTFTRALLRSHFGDDSLIVRSPTYNYYQKYGENIYHFDLYRVDTFEDLYLLGVIEILENTDNICIIEWPEILGDFQIPTIEISLEIQENLSRKITLKKYIV